MELHNAFNCVWFVTSTRFFSQPSFHFHSAAGGHWVGADEDVASTHGIAFSSFSELLRHAPSTNLCLKTAVHDSRSDR